MNIIKTKAKQIRKALKYKITPENLMQRIREAGFSVDFYDQNGDKLRQYELEKHIEYSKAVDSFTYIGDDKKIVFIADSLPEETILHSLAHELAHIEFGHLKKMKNLRNQHKEEMEAEALAYSILNPSQTAGLVKTIVLCTAALLLGLGISHIKSLFNSTGNEYTAPQVTQIQTKYSAPAADEEAVTVYVTPSGTKFHRSDCRYVKGKDCREYSRENAELKYAPCSVCKP